MSLEAAIAELTAAVKENTEAHAKLAEVAKATQQAKAAPKKAAPEAEKPEAEKPEAEKPEAEKPEAEKPAPKKAAAKPKAAPKKAAAKPKAPTLSATVDRDEFKNAARAFMSAEDEETRDKNKANFAAALNHLGASKLTDVDDEDLPRLAGYIAYWSAGLEVDFEEIDALLADMSSDEDDRASDEEADDEMLA